MSELWNELGPDFLKALSYENPLRVAGGLVATGVDAASGLPLAEAAQKIIQAVGSYRDHLLLKKLVIILTDISRVPQTDRERQIAKLTVDEDYRGRVAENLMLLIDSLNDMRKPAMIAKALKAYLRAHISRDDLWELCRAIEQLRVENLQALRDVYIGTVSPGGLNRINPRWKDGAIIEPPDPRNVPDNGRTATPVDWRRLEQFALWGLLSMSFGRGGGVGGTLGGLRINELGKLFMSVVLESPS